MDLFGKVQRLRMRLIEVSDCEGFFFGVQCGEV
jgi:hypothetical protein